MTNIKHTPTPWILSGATTEIRSDKGELIATTNHHLEIRSEATKKANAAFIVKAVNFHEKLVKAIANALDVARAEVKYSGETQHNIKELEEALTAAEGK